jgi:hypothetical protein
METVHTYLDRKHEEISLLNACLRRPFRLRMAKTVNAIVEQKFRLAAALKAQEACDHWAFTETAWAAENVHRSGPFRFRYDYQRAGLEVAGPPIYELLKSVPPDHFQRTVYTSSGMAAISAVLAALEQLNKPVEVIAFPTTYSETLELIENYSQNLQLQWFTNRRQPGSKSSSCRALWLDCCMQPATFKDILSSSAHSFDLILFDTTGLWIGSGRIRRLLNWAIGAGVPIILLRSHTKLDSLGVEYGRLGSMVFVDVPGCGLAKDASLEWIANQAANAIRLFGGTALPAHFPPFAGSRNYESLSRRRIAAMLHNSRRIRKRLRILMPSAELDFVHGLYVVLLPDNMLSEQQAKDLAKSMCRDLGAIGIPIHQPAVSASTSPQPSGSATLHMTDIWSGWPCPICRANSGTMSSMRSSDGGRPTPVR